MKKQKSRRKKKIKDKGKHRCSRKLRKNQALDSRVSQGLWSEPVGPFIFGIRNRASFD
jgi:hypothetical protein